MIGNNKIELCPAAMLDIVNKGFKNTKGMEGIEIKSIGYLASGSGTFKLGLVADEDEVKK